MKLDERLRATIPSALSPLDHDALQRRGRRRRVGARLTAVAAIVAVAGLGTALVHGLATAPPTAPPAGAPADTDATPVDEASVDDAVEAPTDDRVTANPPQATDAGVATEEDELRAADQPAEQPQPDPDPAVVEAFAGLSHLEVIERLVTVLDATPERPSDLVSITIAREHDDDTVTELSGHETQHDFPVVTVLHPDFDPSRGFETPALQPTWTQETAALALDALRESSRFRAAGVTVDPLGRTVLVFASTTSAQEIHVDPTSGYTTGVLVEVATEDDPP